MRCVAAILGGSMLAGCASSSVSQDTQPLPIAQVSESHYEELTASALAFSPPVLNGSSTLADFSREPRESSAFVGYEEQTINSVYVRTDDRQTGDRRGDHYERHAIVEKIGTSYR